MKKTNTNKKAQAWWAKMTEQEKKDRLDALQKGREKYQEVAKEALKRYRDTLTVDTL